MIVDLLAGFGMYSNKSYEYWCKSDNVYTVALSNLSMIVPVTKDNVVNDVTIPQHFDHLKLDLSAAYVEINGPVNHYNENGVFDFNVVLGEQKPSTEKYPILVSFKHHERHPLNQISHGQQSSHYTDCLCCESILVKGSYHYHSVVSEDVQDSMFLTVIMTSPTLVLYAEVYPFIQNFIENVLGTNQFTVTEEEYHSMQNSNRQSFFLKYFNDYRQIKKNIVLLYGINEVQLCTFTTLSLQDITVQIPNSLFIPTSLHYTPSHFNETLRDSTSNCIEFTVSDINVDFSTNPAVFDMNLITSDILCSIPYSEKYESSHNSS